MSKQPPSKTVELRLSKTPPARLQRAMEQACDAASVQLDVQNGAAMELMVREAAGQHYVGVGLTNLNRVEIDGAVGDYALCGSDQCETTIQGNAGDFLGHSFRSGVVIITGNAGDSVGAMGVGGLIAVYGSAGNRVGVSLQGADVLIRGNAGADVGFGMRSGTIIIGGSAGPNMGRGMRGGTIYVRGEATDVCGEIEEVRMREPDRLKLGLLLMKSGIKSSSGKEFRVYRPRADA